jgi:hypothetical protein
MAQRRVSFRDREGIRATVADSRHVDGYSSTSRVGTSAVFRDPGKQPAKRRAWHRTEANRIACSMI